MTSAPSLATGSAAPSQPPSSWFLTPQPRPHARLRLFCFPFAGGSASFFHSWARTLPDIVEVTAIEPPGRGMRFTDPLRRHMSAVVDPLVDALASRCDRPFVLLGHSLGALVGFETARRLQARGLTPSAFIASGRRGPCTGRDGPPLHQMAETALVQHLRQYNGTPQEILDDADMRALFLPIIRADLEINETYPYTAGEKLRCPLYAYAGADDSEAPPALVSRWQHQTTQDFSIEVFPGGHFFLKDHEDNFLVHLSAVLEGIAGPVLPSRSPCS